MYGVLPKLHRSWLAFVMKLDPRPTSASALYGHSCHTFSALPFSLSRRCGICVRTRWTC
jgi:hypothetical protein